MGNRNDGKEAEVPFIVAHAAMEQRFNTTRIIEKDIEVAKISADAQYHSAAVQAEAAKLSAKAQITTADINAGVQVFTAKTAADAQVKVAKVTNDPITLDANEAEAYELIKKTGILKDLAGFEAKLAAGDKEALLDARKLENALKKDGKDLTADGKITDKTISAARGLIGENLDVISKYENVMNDLGAKSPGAEGIKPQSSDIIKK